MKHKKSKEGLKIARLIMVLSSMAPLFILWAIRGKSIIPEIYFIPFCLLMAIIPNVLLYYRIKISKKNKDKRELKIGSTEYQQDHALVYLLAMTLPFYTADHQSYRELAATTVAFLLVVFMFWNLNLHYVNLLFAMFGYRVHSVSSPSDCNDLNGNQRFTLITKRTHLTPNSTITAHRISDTVYLEQ